MFDRVAFLRLTEEKKARLESFLKRALACLNEPPSILARRILQLVECPLCFHFYRPRARVHVPTRGETKCLICGEPLKDPVRSDLQPIHKECAREHEICLSCLADLGLRTRRRKFPTLLGKTERESVVYLREKTRDANEKLKDLLKRAALAREDVLRKERLSTLECPVCFYIDQERFSAGIRKRGCLICEREIYEGKLCEVCAEKFQLCKTCGAEIDLKARRKKNLPF